MVRYYHGLALVVCVLISTTATAEERSFYDKNGSFAGSSNTYNAGKNTTFTDKDGRFNGSAIRNSDGTTSLYDKSGHFTGSVVNPRGANK